MLEKRKTAIIFTANTSHLAHANLMLDSLRDKYKGNFQGDIWVISTGLSTRAKNFLDSIDVKYLISSLSSLNKWKYWKQVAEVQPQYEELIQEKSKEESLQIAFESYRNKRMSKLIILDWIEKFGSNYDFIALCDNDLYFQKDIHKLFEQVYKEEVEKIYYWKEENEMFPGTPLWRKNFHYSYRYDATNLDFGKNEINIGFIMAKPSIMYQVFCDVKNSFFNLNIELFTKHNWHDQDLVRLNKAKNPERYELIQEGEIVHICNGGIKVIEEKYPQEFYHLKTKEKPYVIHFAGGTWEKYYSIKSTYMIDPDDYYFSQELKEEYDIIRKGSFQNLFDNVTDKYFTEENKKSKLDSRKEWINLSNNGKKKIVFIGWLATATHKSTIDAIPDFFNHDLYDIAILNGNVTGREQRKLYEDFPIILAQLTRIIKDPYLVRTYGYKLPNVPEGLYNDIIKSTIVEYDCTERQATAVANLVYLYFAEALDFYKPDLVCLWGFLSPWGKMIRDICKWKKIPICSLEWGILPGTVAFDFCGHMAESWVSQKSGYFNSLPLNEIDLKTAEEYLLNANNPQFSRNLPQNITEDVYKKISRLKKFGKKIILYMESNSAHSGNTLFDMERASIHSSFFSDDKEAYQYLCQLCKNHEDWHILYKPHPISITRGIKTNIDKKNTTIIYQGGLSEVFSLADVSITILSQGAYVSLVNNIPTILLGRLQLNDSGAAYVLEEKENLELIIENALIDGFTKIMRQYFVEHVARVLKYYVFKANSQVQARDSYELGKTIIDIITGEQEDYYKYERQNYCKQLSDKKLTRNENPIVSIIMPVYNSEEYLATCINSICSQTLTSFELICINNGSTDKSQEILDYFALHDSRIRIYNQEKPNQRAARNLGYDCAKGKYVYLIDSDDYLDVNALETLVDIADNKNADLLYFFFREVKTDFNSVRPRPRWYSYRRFFPEEKVFQMQEEHYKFFIQYPFPWAKLIKRELIMENHLYFDLECSNFDDNPHNLRVLLNAKNIYICNEQFYNFRIHDKSMTQSKNSRIIGMLDAVQIMNEIYDEFDCYDVYAKWYVPYKIHLLAWAWDLLPEELQEEYFNKLKKLFFDKDKEYFVNDFVWSYYEMPSSVYYKRIEDMLSQNYEQFKEEMNR